MHIWASLFFALRQSFHMEVYRWASVNISKMGDISGYPKAPCLPPVIPSSIYLKKSGQIQLMMALSSNDLKAL